MEGVSRFLARVWRLSMEENQAGEWIFPTQSQEVEPTRAQQKSSTPRSRRSREDIEALSFNTAIAQMMIFVNAFTNARPARLRLCARSPVLLNPFAPHLTSELWETLGEKFPLEPAEITGQSWPNYNAEFLVEDEVEIAVQVNGKVRDELVSDCRDEGRT